MSTRNALFWLGVIAATVLAGGIAGLGDGAGPPGSPGSAAGGGRSRPDSGGGGGAGGLRARAGAALAVRVTRVVDGDTVQVQGPGGARDTVRYIGVDTPESVKPRTPVQCFAKAASHRNAELVQGRAVRLLLGAEPRDRYGRLLAYVFRAQDGRFVNEELLAGGFARTLTIPPNDRYAARFAAHAAAAARARRGLWGAC